MRIAIVGIYVAVLVGVVVAVDVDAANGDRALLAWSVASLVLGWAIRHPWAMILPFIGIPLSVPFGTSEQWVGSDTPLIVIGMVFQAPFQAALVAVGFGGRFLFERVRARLTHAAR